MLGLYVQQGRDETPECRLLGFVILARIGQFLLAWVLLAPLLNLE